MLTAEEVRNYVENYEDHAKSLEKMQKRLISMSGRDLEQESAIMYRIEQLEQGMAIADSAIGMKELSNREEAAVLWRLEGKTYQEIGEIFSVTHERARQLLTSAYEKMAAKSQTMRRRRR